MNINSFINKFSTVEIPIKSEWKEKEKKRNHSQIHETHNLSDIELNEFSLNYVKINLQIEFFRIQIVWHNCGLNFSVEIAERIL